MLMKCKNLNGYNETVKKYIIEGVRKFPVPLNQTISLTSGSIRGSLPASGE